MKTDFFFFFFFFFFLTPFAVPKVTLTLCRVGLPCATVRENVCGRWRTARAHGGSLSKRATR